MRRNDFFGTGLTLTIALLSLPTGAAEVTAGAGLLYFDYQEFSTVGTSLNHETGTLPGITLGAGEKFFGLDHSIALTAWHGQVDYRGRTQAGAPHATKTEQSVYDLHYRIDWRPEETAGGLYGKVGWNHWDRDIQPANGVAGLFERYRWWTLETGVQADLYQAGGNKLFVEFGVLATVNGTIKVDLRNSGYGYPSLDLGDGTGIAVRAGWSRRIDDRAEFSISLDYTRWGFDRSESETVSGGVNPITITEPQSRSKQAGLRFIYRYEL